MKKTTYFAVFLALFTFSACSDSTETSHTEEVIATDEPVTGQVVVEAPDYTSVAEPMQRNVSQLVDQYIKLKDALVASDAAAAKTAATDMLQMINAMPVATLEGEQKNYAEEKIDKMKQAVSIVSSTDDLAVQRQNLEQISEATFGMAKAFGGSDQTLYYQHCPMAFNDQGAYWLSTNKEVRNPYFGESMLKCGTNEEIHKRN
jgi:hypothetical protein